MRISDWSSDVCSSDLVGSPRTPPSAWRWRWVPASASGWVCRPTTTWRKCIVSWVTSPARSNGWRREAEPLGGLSGKKEGNWGRDRSFPNLLPARLVKFTLDGETYAKIGKAQVG